MNLFDLARYDETRDGQCWAVQAKNDETNTIRAVDSLDQAYEDGAKAVAAGVPYVAILRLRARCRRRPGQSIPPAFVHRVLT